MISFAIVITAVAISFLVALFWLAVINYSTGFLRWENNNVFNLAIGGIATVGIAGLLEFLLLEDRYLFSLKFFEVSQILENSLIFYVAIAALIEEFLKGVVVWWGIGMATIRKAREGMIVGMIVGLFFAVAENGIYFATQIHSSSLEEVFSLVVARTVFSSIAHMIFSGIIGFFIVKGIGLQNNLGRTLFILFGLVLSSLIHTMFNASVAFGVSWLPILVIVIGGVFAFFVLRNNSN